MALLPGWGAFVTVQSTDLEYLLRRVASGDREAFSALYAATSAKLNGIVLRIIRDRSLAEDILQEAFVRVWRNAERYDAASGRPATWLAAIARNAAIDVLRQRQAHFARHKDVGDDALAAVPDRTASSGNPGDRQALRGCLGELADEHRACVLLAYQDGWSREELAERYDRPVGTIKTWLHRGLKQLRECLERE